MVTMKGRRISSILAAFLICSLLLSACGTGSATQSGGTQAGENGLVAGGASQTPAGSDPGGTAGSEAIVITEDMMAYDGDDEYSDWESQNPNYIYLNGMGASLKGTGAAINGSTVTIGAAGVYVLSGKLDDGQIIVDSQAEGVVRLVLNGAEINCSDSSAIYVMNADKTVLSLPEGSKNIVSDGKEYIYPDAETDEPNAAIFSKDDLTVNGKGTLTVYGNYNNGIASKDKLKITGGTISVTSVDDALMGRDAVLMKSGSLTIEAEGDGIKATNDTDAARGFIALEGGDYSIRAGASGIQAETALLITGGTFGIDSTDDALHSNNSVTITGGDLAISSGDDGIHADTAILIKGGSIDITKCYEGIESSYITVADGTMRVVSSDDGFNISGGNDGSSVNGRPGQGSFSSAEAGRLEIDGGNIWVDSSGDGLDSNGSIAMKGGTVVVNGPTNGGNGALDYDGGFEMTGGFLIAVGSAGMAQAPSDGSTVNSIAMTFPGMQQAGTLIHVEDNEGNPVATFAPAKEYQSVVISSPDLKMDSEYTLYTSGRAAGNASDGLYTDGVYEKGTKLVGFTITQTVTWLDETGVTTAKSGFGTGGPGGFGGGRQGRPAGDGQRGF